MDKNNLICPVEGCNKLKRYAGNPYCSMHITRLWRTGILDLKVKSLEERFEENIERITESGCWIWMGYTTQGYGRLGIDGKYILAHRAVYEERKDKIPDGLFLCHHCDTPACVNPYHMFIGTNLDNMRDMYQKGRGSKLKGEDCTHAILKEKDVLFILNTSDSASFLAEKYKVRPTTIYKIREGKSWKHIPR